MKKILSFALIFVLSLSVYSTFEVKAAATEDVTINFHIYQFDGDYTNTGLGIWDGVDWNNWADVQTSTDDFGAVITKTWTADKVNNEAFLAEMQVKPTRNASVDDAANYLAPASIGGQPLLDVSSLIDGSKTELDVYYVEGAKSFYTAVNDNGLFMNVFVNPAVAADATAYDGWGMHVWNNGAAGSSATWEEPIAYTIDVELQVGEYLVPMKLGVLEISQGATVGTGFIVHKGDSKAYPNDILFDSTVVLGEKDDEATTDVDESTPNKATVALYEFGNDGFTADYSTFLTNVEASYKDNLKNKFMGATILTPDSLTATMLTPKSLFDLDLDRFSVTNAAGTVISITGIDYGTTPAFSPVSSDVEIEFQTYVRVYVDTELTNVGLVGAFQGWDITAPVAPVGTYEGYQVFEVSTNVMNFEYVVVAHDRVDDVNTTDVDEAAFTWDDKVSGDSNLVAELTPGDSYMAVFVDETDMLYSMGGFAMTDVANYTYTSTAPTCAANEKLLTVFVETDMPTTDLTLFGLVGTPQQSGWDTTLNDGDGGWTNGGWSPESAINPVAVDANGYLVFEICVDTDNDSLHQEFKVLYDSGDDTETADVDESGFNWGDPELTAQVVFDFADEEGSSMAMFHNNTIFTTDLAAYTATIEVSNTYRYTLYLNPGDLDITDFAVVGAFDEHAWDPLNPMTFTMMDSEGNYYIDFAIHTKDFEYKVLYNATDDDPLTTDVDESAFDWSQSIFGNDNCNSMLGDASFKAEMISYTMVEEVMTWAKESLMDVTTTTMTLNFAADTLMHGTNYTISYVEAYGEGDVEDTVISLSALDFATSNNFVVGDDIAQTGTYALLPTKINVIFENEVAIATDMGVKLLDKDDNEIAIESIMPLYSKGTYTPTVTTCDAGSTMLTVYLQTNDMITDLSTVGLVGTPQQTSWDTTLNEGAGGFAGGWDPSTAINPVGIDSNGNLVFEICVLTTGAATDEVNNHVEFKVLFNAEGTFAWGDTEITPQIVFDFDGAKEMFLEQGKVEGNTTSFVYMLAEENKLKNTGGYSLQFTDEKGFVINYGVIVDNQAPEVDASRKTDVPLTIDNDAESFNIMDYFNILRFVDNYDGVIAYNVDQPVELTMTGKQSVIVSATDVWGNKGFAYYVFTVNDVIAPVITLEASPTFVAGTAAPEWNEYASVVGGTLVINDAQVDMSSAGEFYVVFTASDKAGNTSTENLKVTITAIPVVEDPTDALDETGCFGSVGAGAAFVAVLSLLGTAAFVAIRKR